MQDHEFPVDAFREAGYHSAFRGMKGYNGVATLTRDGAGARLSRSLRGSGQRGRAHPANGREWRRDREHVRAAGVQDQLGQIRVQARVVRAR